MAESSAAKRTAASGTPTSIHDLPETLLIKILSLLHTYDAVCFSSASPKFRHLCHSIPILDFTISNFPFCGSPSSTRESFADFVNQTLLLRRRRRTTTAVHKFKLVFHYTRHHRHRSLINSWLRYALNSGATKVGFNFAVTLNDELAFSDDDDDAAAAPCRFDFHFSDFRNSCVEKMSFSRCDLTVLPFTNGFNCLRSLKLVDLHITEETLSTLLSGCRNLESFSLIEFRGPTNLKICSDNLKELDLRLFVPTDFKNSSLEIVAPTLETITLAQVCVWKFCLDDSCIASLVDGYVNIYKLDCVWGNYLSSLTGVKRLTLKQNHLYQFWRHPSHRHLSFNNLVHLEMNTAYTEKELLGLAVLLQSSPKIRIMVLHCDQTDDNEGLPEHFMTRPLLLNIPSLKRIEIRNSKGGNSELDFIVLLKMQKVVLDKVVIVPAKVGEISLPPMVLDWSAVPPNVIDWSGRKS